jgi:hypothetical protein
MRIARIPASGSAIVALTFLICAMADTAAAQWLSIPLPGTPRAPDGKPNSHREREIKRAQLMLLILFHAPTLVGV